MRKPLLALTVLAGVVTAATPAAAAPTDDTIVTFSVGTANLEIFAPTSVNLGSTFAGSIIQGQLGSVQVVDQRAALNATWVATVSSTEFTTGSGSPEETVPPGLIEYWSGPPLSSTGTGTFVPGQPTQAEAVTLSVPRTAFSKTSGSGNNSVTWNPTLRVNVPGTVVAGTYTATVTHSVA
ncbi:hypothetical protein [Micromonospora sagamiensis]|uniref:WxL domain-containing protein n=1 Tax=Micromonospora sagamiensis TaxID=47875 RepID=A0A562W9G9_9ACTN|nr:hypothetical protein [Micromonospora sagamiensis]TWJ26775.1 hypothetical protein JD81_00238 [Micromonospora sagamiensis]BCL14337.1 hypothetical protein GCM10017556_20760 [Micromonospora sagamiensis]